MGRNRGLVCTVLDLSTMGTKLLALSQGVGSQSVIHSYNPPNGKNCRKKEK